jgi:hypothetical protein
MLLFRLVPGSLDTRVILSRVVVLVEHGIIRSPVRTRLGICRQDARLFKHRSNDFRRLNELKRQTSRCVKGNLKREN